MSVLKDKQKRKSFVELKGNPNEIINYGDNNDNNSDTKQEDNPLKTSDYNEIISIKNGSTNNIHSNINGLNTNDINNINGTINNDTIINNDDNKEMNNNNNNNDLIILNKNTSILSWDEIDITKQEREGCLEYQQLLNKKYIIKYTPNFEIARYFLGSKCRIEKATIKWLDTIDMYQKYKLNEVTNDTLKLYANKMSKYISFGGINKDGCCIIALKYSMFYPKNYKDYSSLLKIFLYIIMVITEDLNVSRNGVIFIADMKGYTVKNVSINLLKITIGLMKEICPLKIKGLYLVDAPKIVNGLIKIMKPFLSKKMQSRVTICSRNDLYKKMNANIIPIISGGKYNNDKLKPFYKNLIYFIDKTNIDDIFYIKNFNVKQSKKKSLANKIKILENSN